MIVKDIPGISTEHSRRILELFTSLPTGSEVWVFGSRAKGTYREGSDIDLAIKGSGVSLSLKERSELLEKYESVFLPWKLDIVAYDSIEDPQLRGHIDRVGVLVFRVTNPGPISKTG